MKRIILDIEPIGKPRMVRSDIWSGRLAVSKYWKYKDDLNILAKSNGIDMNNEYELNIKFFITMPKSWSKKMKKELNGNNHLLKPDLDNLVKAFLDCLMENDSKIYKINSSKYWATKGYIQVMI